MVVSQVQFLQSHKVNIVVGTPKRLLDLSATKGGITWDRLRLLVVDLSKDRCVASVEQEDFRAHTYLYYSGRLF